MKRLSFSDAKQIPIAEYLSSLRFEPVKPRGHNLWYHAPYRDDRTPSFKVDTRQNVWYDHGIGEGGTIIELGMKLHQCTAVEFLNKLSNDNYQLNFKNSVHRPPAEPENAVEIHDVKPLTDEGLLFYINRRGIDNKLAKLNCKEIDFSIKGRLYHAIGFPNCSGGWELRNSWFKGSSSPKDISLIQVGQSKRLAVCEGFIDYLSILKMDDLPIKQFINNSDFLILNSLSFAHKNDEILKSYAEVNLFLDNDNAARKAMSTFTLEDIKFQDRSDFYRNHKDLNEFLMERLKLTSSITNKKSKGMSI